MIYYNLFIENLTRLRNRSNLDDSALASIYLSLFLMQEKNAVENELAYLHQLSKGEDSFYKESGKESWFAIWHKSIRQCDHFNGYFHERELKLLTKEETAELRFLRDKISEEGYVKHANDGKTLFTEEYNRYLELCRKLRAEKDRVSISGHLDSILWNMISLNNNILYDIFNDTFEEVEMKTLSKS